MKSSHQDSLLGMDQPITRRDFLNATLLGAGALLLELPAPLALRAQNEAWEGYGGVGDYAKSHGNTWEVVSVAHDIRDGRYDFLPADVVETGETYDLVVVGGGFSGLGAAFEFKKAGRRGQVCLLLDNHPIFGGEAKRNEFLVDGYRLMGPQGSNGSIIPSPDAPHYELHKELGVPWEFEYQSWDPKFKPLEFYRENYGFMLWGDHSPSNGYFFDGGSQGEEPRWVRNMWGRKFEGTPYPEKVKQDFLRWRNSREKHYEGEDLERWLDTMSYADYIEKVMGLSPEVTKFADPIVASGLGLGCDVVSAYTAYSVMLPGFKGFSFESMPLRRDWVDRVPTPENIAWFSFPGGNAALARYFVKFLIPDAIQGERTLEDILTHRVNFQALDRPGNQIRMRLGSTAVRVEHADEPNRSEHVSVTYVRGGKTYRVKARGVVMASGGWMNRYVVRDLPSEYETAYKQFHHAPMLVANVALTNWRFMYKLGVTACRWFDGFGFSCNIRRPMVVGAYRQPLDPDKPTVLTFNVSFPYPGRPAKEQGAQGRWELQTTRYRDYERQIREQMVRLFGQAGFDPKRDIAGIILNRWGHAYIVPQPGFYFGRDGRPAPRDVIRQRFGRIAFGHSELRGHQNWIGGAIEGQRAARQALEVL